LFFTTSAVRWRNSRAGIAVTLEHLWGCCHWFFEINSFTGFKRGNALFFMEEIRRSNKYRVNIVTFE
jgi:hypothetical protein